MFRVSGVTPFCLGVLLPLVLLGCATPPPAAPDRPLAAPGRPLRISENISRIAVFLCKHDQFPLPVLSRFPEGTQPADYIRSEDLDFLRRKPDLALMTELDRPGLHAELARYVQCDVVDAVSTGYRVKVAMRRTRPQWEKEVLPSQIMKGTPGPEQVRKALEEWSRRNPPTVTSLYTLRFVWTPAGWRADYQLPEDEHRHAHRATPQALADGSKSSNKPGDEYLAQPPPGAPPVPEDSRPWEGTVLPFGAGMTRPEKISGPIPQYTKEALENYVQGLMIVKCIITREGEVRKCRIVKPLPFMEAAVVEALYQSRYKPVTFKGEPLNIDYTFNIKLSLPRTEWTVPNGPGR